MFFFSSLQFHFTCVLLEARRLRRLGQTPKAKKWGIEVKENTTSNVDWIRTDRGFNFGFVFKGELAIIAHSNRLLDLLIWMHALGVFGGATSEFVHVGIDRSSPVRLVCARACFQTFKWRFGSALGLLRPFRWWRNFVRLHNCVVDGKWVRRLEMLQSMDTVTLMTIGG